MSVPDTAASAILDATVIKPVWFAYLDFLGDPARACTAGVNMTISGTPDPELNGTYIGVDARFVEISDVQSSSGGGDTVTARLSGLRGMDDEDRDMLGNPANWQGRVARFWRMLRDQNNVQQGGFQAYYTGYMQSLAHIGSPDDLTLELSIEGYLAAFSVASNRTFMSQPWYDELDLSPRATIATINGMGSTSLTYTPLGDYQPYNPATPNNYDSGPSWL